MQIVSSYTLSPGQDYLSGSNQLPVIDTGIDVDRDSPWGRIYLSEDTVGTMASMFGWAPPRVLAALEERIGELSELNDHLEEQNSELRAAVDALKAAGYQPA